MSQYALVNQPNELLGASKFGASKKHSFSVTVFGGDVWVHLRDRGNKKSVTMKGADFYLLLRKKEKIVSLVEKGYKVLAKIRSKEVAEDESDSDDDSVYTSDEEYEEVVAEIKEKTSKKGKGKGRKKHKVADEMTGESDQSECEPKKTLKRKNSNSSISAVVDDVKAPKKSKPSKSKKAKPDLASTQHSSASQSTVEVN